MSDVAAPAKAAKGLWGRTKARLGKKLGPLPLWGWLALAGVGVVYYIRRKNAAAATTATPDTTATPADTSATDPLAGGTTDTGSGGGTSGGGVPSGGGGTGSGGAGPSTSDTTPAVAPSGADVTATPTGTPGSGLIAGAPPARGAPQESLIATSRTGAKLYETSTGAILEQVKGKSPYRVAAAGSAAAKRILANVTKPGNPLRTAGAAAKVAAKPRPKAKTAPARHTTHVQKKTVRVRGSKI